MGTFPFMEHSYQFTRMYDKQISINVGIVDIGDWSLYLKNLLFSTSFVKFIAVVRWQPLSYKQSPTFTQKFQKKVSLFLQINMKITLFVKTTESPITTTRRVFYPLVNIKLYFLEMLKSY